MARLVKIGNPLGEGQIPKTLMQQAYLASDEKLVW